MPPSRRAAVVGTGRQLGEGVVSTEEIVLACGVAPTQLEDERLQQLVQNAFPVRRRVVDPDTSTATLFIEAGKRALASAGIAASELSLLICVSDTPDYISPATAARVQHGLGATPAGFFDLNSACAGFTIALTMASSYIGCFEEAGPVMIVGGNVYSRFLAPKDLLGQLLFSDGAGAVVLAPSGSKDHGFCASTVYGDGQFWGHWGIFAGGTWKPFSQENVEAGFHQLKLIRPYEKELNLRNWPRVIDETLRKTGWGPGDVERAFLTQARRGPIDATCGRYGWEPTISYDTADRYGYLGSGCIPVALDDAVEHGMLSPGQRLLIVTSGLGYSCCAATLVWGR